MTGNEIARKRSILFSARTRYSAQIQPIRESAIDKILEQNLLVSDSPDGLSLEAIREQGGACFAGGMPALSHSDMRSSLNRLELQGRVDKQKLGGEFVYKLSPNALEELWKTQEAAEERFTKTVRRLLKDSAENHRDYLAPFLECLCIIFAELGEKYVRVIKGEIKHEEMLSTSTIISALKVVIEKYKNVNKSTIESMISTFFRETDPDYDAIKWNLAQNYYLAKALGLDPGGLLFSKEVFGGSTLFLDTNVVIPGLDPTARHHKSFKALSHACRNLEIDLNVCQVSLAELSRVVAYQTSLISQVAAQIPEATGPKVRGGFYRLYREQLKLNPDATVAEIFSAFTAPMKVLVNDYKVALIDDEWFVKAERAIETTKVVEKLKTEFKRKRNRTKGQGSATHDALMLRWIELERRKESRRTWLITLDTSLPTFKMDSVEDGTPLAITLDAFLQWISPLALLDEANEDMAVIFAEAMRYQLLPQENLFDLRDFLVFAEMEWSCKDVPAEDVEGCIRYLKAQAPNLDPTKSEDREKLSLEISKFFADPGRKYKRAIEEAEAFALAASEQSEKKVSELKEKVDLQRETIADLGKTLSDAQAALVDERLHESAILRLILLFLGLVVIEIAIGYAASRYAEGSTLRQKLWSSKEWLGLGFGVTIIASWFALGRERIRVLAWPIRKLLGGES
jgi:hypothetical protein